MMKLDCILIDMGEPRPDSFFSLGSAAPPAVVSCFGGLFLALSNFKVGDFPNLDGEPPPNFVGEAELC